MKITSQKSYKQIAIDLSKEKQHLETQLAISLQNQQNLQKAIRQLQEQLAKGQLQQSSMSKSPSFKSCNTISQAMTPTRNYFSGSKQAKVSILEEYKQEPQHTNTNTQQYMDLRQIIELKEKQILLLQAQVNMCDCLQKKEKKNSNKNNDYNSSNNNSSNNNKTQDQSNGILGNSYQRKESKKITFAELPFNALIMDNDIQINQKQQEQHSISIQATPTMLSQECQCEIQNITEITMPDNTDIPNNKQNELNKPINTEIPAVDAINGTLTQLLTETEEQMEILFKQLFQ